MRSKKKKWEEEEKASSEDKENVDQNTASTLREASNQPKQSDHHEESEEEGAIKLEDIYEGNPEELDLSPVEPYNCETCQNNPSRNCKECACNICGVKKHDDITLMCEECDYYFHTYCLDPPLAAVPKGHWYCPDCKNDVNEIVGAGERMKISKKKAKMPSEVNRSSKRDWGKGMATAGRTRVCTKVSDKHFGPIPGIDVGMCWKYRMQLCEEGIHRPPVAGIAGQPTIGCQSIVLAGGYEDDVDNGEEFYYTGSGGRDLSGNKRCAEQSFDQTLTKSNLSIAISCAAKVNDKDGAEAKEWRKGKPIRVVRSEKLSKHSKYAPKEGNRYDGLYKVVRYWPQKGKAGFIVWRYLFRRDDTSPAPWTKEGQELIETNGYKCIYPPNQDPKKSKNTSVNEGKGKGKGKGKSSEKKVEEMSTKKARSGYRVPDHIVRLIQLDVANIKVWEDLNEQLDMKKVKKEANGDNLNKLDFTNMVEEAFTCIICFHLIDNPYTTECNHNMCKDCWIRLKQAGELKCPVCRADLEGKRTDKNKNLDAVLAAVFGREVSLSSVDNVDEPEPEPETGDPEERKEMTEAPFNEESCSNSGVLNSGSTSCSSPTGRRGRRRKVMMTEGSLDEETCVVSPVKQRMAASMSTSVDRKVNSGVLNSNSASCRSSTSRRGKRRKVYYTDDHNEDEDKEEIVPESRRPGLMKASKTVSPSDDKAKTGGKANASDDDDDDDVVILD